MELSDNIVSVGTSVAAGGPVRSIVRILQHNCRKTYAVTIAALEAGLHLQLGVGQVCLQEPCIGKEFRHGGYQIYWPEAGAQRNPIRRGLFNQMVEETTTDLINHPYIMALDIWELGLAKEKTGRTCVINWYDNWLGTDQCWQGNTEGRRVMEDIHLDGVLWGRCVVGTEKTGPCRCTNRNHNESESL